MKKETYMNQPVMINKLSMMLGLTSRTLRYWETEGLFQSDRNPESGWREYSFDTVVLIQIVAQLRSLDIPLRDIKTFLDDSTTKGLGDILHNKLTTLDNGVKELSELQCKIRQMLKYMSLKTQHSETTHIELEDLLRSGINNNKNLIKESNKMKNNKKGGIAFISLQDMRMVYNTSIGISPEDDAMKPVIDWLEENNLMGTAKLYGRNTEPYPTEKNPEYGFGMMASIPQGVVVPENLDEMVLKGGVYATMGSNDNIFNSWQQFMEVLAEDDKYIVDKSRPCLEEHIRNDNFKATGGKYIIKLLEPVKLK